jgi:hypothetical protein
MRCRGSREHLDQVRQGVRRPFDQAHRIPFRLQQLFQIPLQGRIRLRRLLPPTPCLANPPFCPCSLSLEFFDPSLYRFPVRSRQRGYLADASIADLERFCSQIQAPLLFIQFFVQELILLLCRHSLIIPGFPRIWKLFADEPLERHQSLVPLQQMASLGVEAAQQLERDGDLTRFSLQKAVMIEVGKAVIWRSEVAAYMALDDYTAALALAQGTSLKEDRLHLLAVIVKAKRKQGLAAEPELVEQIHQLYQQIDHATLGEHAWSC